MSNERAYQTAMMHLEQDVDGFIGAALVEMPAARRLAVHSIERTYDTSMVARAACLTFAAHTSAAEVGPLVTPLEEVALTDGLHIHIYRPITPSLLLVVSATRRDSNLALLRMAALRSAERLSLTMSDRVTPPSA